MEFVGLLVVVALVFVPAVWPAMHTIRSERKPL